MKAKLRPYQIEARDAVLAELHRHRSTLVVIPTGGGKTVLFAALAELACRRGRVLVLAHREELIEQAKDKIESFTELACGIEMGDRTLAHSLFELPPVVVASVQRLARYGLNPDVPFEAARRALDAIAAAGWKRAPKELYQDPVLPRTAEAG
jgi:superfamily II DNA or RNA helicase